MALFAFAAVGTLEERGHGMRAVVYLGSDISYICSGSKTGWRYHGWGELGRAGLGPPPRAPFDILAPLPPPPRPQKDWAKFSSGPSANQQFLLALSVPVSLEQNFSSAPLKTQHHFGGGGGGGGLPPAMPP